MGGEFHVGTQSDWLLGAGVLPLNSLCEPAIALDRNQPIKKMHTCACLHLRLSIIRKDVRIRRSEVYSVQTCQVSCSSLGDFHCLDTII